MTLDEINERLAARNLLLTPAPAGLRKYRDFLVPHRPRSSGWRQEKELLRDASRSHTSTRSKKHQLRFSKSLGH